MMLFWGCLPKAMMVIFFLAIPTYVLLRVTVAGCLIASLALDTNEGPETNSQYWVNTMRDSFTCSPRFSGLLLAGRLDFTHGACIPFSLIISFRFISSTFCSPPPPTCDRIYTGNHFRPRTLHFLRRNDGRLCHFSHLNKFASGKEE
jgi:hypothetical protein